MLSNFSSFRTALSIRPKTSKNGPKKEVRKKLHGRLIRTSKFLPYRQKLAKNGIKFKILYNNNTKNESKKIKKTDENSEKIQEDNNFEKKYRHKIVRKK